MVDSIDIIKDSLLDMFSLCYRDAVSLRSRHLCVDMPIGAMYDLNVFYMTKLLVEVSNCLFP